MKLLTIPLLLALAVVPAPLMAKTSATVPAKAPAKAAATVKPAPAAPTPVETVASLLTQAKDAQGRGETELALRLAQSAIVADPAQPSAYVGLGDIYAVQGQADAARSYYLEALEIDPQDATALAAIAALDKAKTVATTAP